MTKPLTTRHPSRPSTYYVNNVKTTGAQLPEGLSIEWTINTYYCEVEKRIRWEDDCRLVNAAESPTFYDNIEDYHSDDWKHERSRVVDTVQDTVCAHDVYYRKADILKAISRSVINVVRYNDHYEISAV